MDKITSLRAEIVKLIPLIETFTPITTLSELKRIRRVNTYWYTWNVKLASATYI